MQHVEVPPTFTSYQLDTSRPNSELYSKITHIISAICEGTRLLISEAVPDISAKTICFINKRIILQYRIPLTLKTECYMSFRSVHYIELCNFMGIKPYWRLAYSHMSIGLIEVTHSLLAAMIKTRISQNGNDKKNWDMNLEECIFSINSSIRPSEGWLPTTWYSRQQI